jgi:tetratricopeptide (TPR) repeat protein
MTRWSPLAWSGTGDDSHNVPPRFAARTVRRHTAVKPLAGSCSAQQCWPEVHHGDGPTDGHTAGRPCDILRTVPDLARPQSAKSEAHVDDAPAPAVSLPCRLPATYPTEPAELTAYRKSRGDEKSFLKLRRAFREAEDWRALATLLVLHGASLERDPATRNKAAELCIQAYELWLERVKDRDEATHALARAVQLRPDNKRAQDRLRKLYESMGAYKELVGLLRWRLRTTPDSSDAAALHLELAELLEQQFLAIGEAVQHLEQVLHLDPSVVGAGNRLIDLYLRAGAWQRAAELIRFELERIDPTEHRARVAELHRRLAEIESEQHDDVAAAARHLQAALKVIPDDIAALRAFGVLYLSSGKATDDGVSKASDIFYKAAELARRKGERAAALKLLRRALNLTPDHQQASAALENTLIDAEDWLALDELYREWLYHFSDEEAVPLLLRRAELLDQHLYRREEARLLYEEASRHQAPDETSWQRLEEIYTESGDFHALAALLDAQVDRDPTQVPTETLLRAAHVYREELGSEERAAVYYYKVLEREPFNAIAFEGYKEHWRRKHNWTHLRDLILYQIEQASSYDEGSAPFDERAFAEEFVELADICERRLGDVDGALDAWTRLAAAYPDDSRPKKNIARIEKRARMWDNMVRVQEAELERTVDPAKRLDILKRLTQVYRDRQVNPDRAIELYTEILELSPNDIQATRALTTLYDRAGDHARVAEMLHEQFERSRSNTERVALLRRMAEIWHHELEDGARAMWACEQILEIAPADREAVYRLQQLLEDEGRHEELLEVLARELKHSGSPDARVKVLRRMARVAERDIEDDDRASELWEQLLSLKPGDLEIMDRLGSIYERSGRYEELSSLLSKAAAATTTPLVRQVDYLLRLGQLAETSLDDPDLARSSFERVLRSRPDHRGALEALVRLYRREDAWKPLVAVLGKLQELAETDDDAFRIAWERAELLGEQLDEPEAAAEILEALSVGTPQGRPEVASSLLDLYERSKQHRKVIRQAEIMLLAVDEPADRRKLYETISNTWLTKLDDKRAALAAYSRYVDEFSDDLDGLWTLAGLQEQVGSYEAALSSLQRRLELADEVQSQTATLGYMAELAEHKLGEPKRALEFVRRALAVDHFNEMMVDRARKLAESHRLWPELLRIYEERSQHFADAGDAAGRVDLCLEGAEVAERKHGDATMAFDWARQAFFVGVDGGIGSDAAEGRLQQLAEDHGLWAQLLEVIEHELDLREKRPANDGPFDPVAKLLQAADIAENRLQDSDRAVELLQRAHRRRPEDEALAAQLEGTAERYGKWHAVIELHGGRLERAVTNLSRFDACCSIARIYQEELDDPEKAFEWLRKTYADLRDANDALANDAFDRILVLAEQHRLWSHLAEFHLRRAERAGARGGANERVGALQEAALVFDERLHDPLAAVRVLARGLTEEHGPDVLLPEIRRLTGKVDEHRDRNLPSLGALLLLSVLQRLIAHATADLERVQFLEERAQIREERLRDPSGAMAEWVRVLRLDPESDRALLELERLAEEADLWSQFLMLPAWQLAHAEDDERRATLLRRIAWVYESPLDRPEYALRARLMAWRLAPELPPRIGELDDDHSALWRLAQRTGAYRTPPVPRDPLLEPEIAAPEVRDLELWRSSGIEPRVLDELPSPFAPRIELAVPVAVPTVTTEEVSLRQVVEDTDDDDELITGVAEPAVEEIEEIEEIDLIEADDLVELVESEDDALTVASAGVISSEAESTRIAGQAPTKPPPPPPAAPDAGLPPLPRLERPIIPPRPRVASAWEEVALAYAEVPAESKQAKADVALVLARLWEEGAGHLERAFQAHEQALMWMPEYPVAVESLDQLADRHEAVDRLLQAYERLLAEAAMPEHLVAIGMRMAELHEARDDLQRAEERYRGVLSVNPTHLQALRAICRIYEFQNRSAEWVDAAAELLEVEGPDLDEDVLVTRNVELCGALAHKVGRMDEAVDRLDLLVRQFPADQRLHANLIDLLLEQEKWQPAIEAMRVASDLVDDEDFRLQNLERVARIYEERLGLPDRAMTVWAEIAETRDDDHALEKLQTLYLDAARHDEALPIIERRLGRLDREGDAEGTREARVSLLVAKARVLQEGLGDEAAATETLEQLVAEEPDNDEAVLGLSRLYRKVGRFDDGITLLRERLAAIEDDGERSARLALMLAEVLDSDGHDPRGALEVVEQALAAQPEQQELLRARADLARALHDPVRLGESLALLDDPDAQLEAANLMRGPVRDGPRAVRLYSRVLAEAKKQPDNAKNRRRLALALEGLVELRVQDGDIKGAMEFMDRQLAEMKGASIRAQLLTEMGRITYRSTHDIEAARRRFDAALEEDPSHARAKLGMGEVLIEAGEMSQAEALLDQAVEALTLAGNTEELVSALVLQARALEAADRLGEAYRKLTAAARHRGDDFDIRAAIVRNRFAAKRWRDVITAAVQLDKQLDEGFERTPERTRVASEIFVMAAKSELEAKQPDKALQRFRQAAELDPKNRDALEPLIGLSQERGALLEAAKHAAALARLTDDVVSRGQRMLEAGMLFHDAAMELADGAERTGGETEADLRKAALEHLRLALDLLEEAGGPAPDRTQLEIAFRATADQHADVALRCLERLLDSSEVEADRRHDLLLQGVDIALGGDDRTDVAERYAREARTLVAASPSAVVALSRVLEATGRVDEIEDLVEQFFADRTTEDEQDVATSVGLLLRLAELQESRPDKAIAALERAATLDPGALGAEDRKRLIELYEQADTRGDRVLDNHLALLAHDPLYEPSLDALANHFMVSGDLDRAHAVYRALVLANPEHEAARWFLRAHEVASASASDLDPESIVPPAPADAGIPSALSLLWDGAHALLGEHLPRLEIPQEARVSPMGDSPLARGWSEMLKRLGQSKVALVDASVLGRSTTDSPRGGHYFEVHAQYPPVILAHERAHQSTNADDLRFALGRALYFTRPDTVFALGLDPPTLARVVSAMLQAFHPRHARRKHHQQHEDAVAKLSQELARKLPMRVSRQLSASLKERAEEPFDSRVWRAWVRRCGTRMGLALGGDVEAAVRVLTARDEAPTHDDLRELVSGSDELRDLLAFAISGEYVEARKTLGFEVKPRPTE